jgi:hypothetical protein
VRNIQADRATGNEASAYYELDLHGEARFDEEIGARARVLLRTPVSKRARSYELFEELNEPFELREAHAFVENGTIGRMSFGKFKLPFGPDDRMEDEPWNQPLLEYYIARTGNYDVGVGWERTWFDLLRTRFAVTSGNTGALDTNSAVAGSGEVSVGNDRLRVGAWGKVNRMDTTPIKRKDDAVGLFVEAEYCNWRLMGKCAWLVQGLRTLDFNEPELEGFDYDDDEIEVLIWMRDQGIGERTLRGWYVVLAAPTIRGLPFFGRRIERIDIFAHYGQVFDPEDPFEHNRERAGVGIFMLLKDTGTARICLSAGLTVDDDTSNTRPYLDREEDINRRNDRTTWWVKLSLLF